MGQMLARDRIKHEILILVSKFQNVKKKIIKSRIDT